MSKRKYIFIICLFVVAVGAAFAGYYIAEGMYSKSTVADLQEIAHTEDSADIEGSDSAEEETSVDSTKEYQATVDIAALQKTNPDIFAWISIPDTDIDYPIVQHPTDDSYYLKHGANGMYSTYGCPFIELSDSQTFLEFNTIIYGHNMNDGSMFAPLHDYEDKDFYDEHREIFIYTADHTFKYEVFAAVMYSDIHIPYYFDDTLESDRTAFLDSLTEDIVQDRSIISEDTSVTEDDCIITLSTCDKTLRSNRYLVVAVLTQIDGQDAR